MPCLTPPWSDQPASDCDTGAADGPDATIISGHAARREYQTGGLRPVTRTDVPLGRVDLSGIGGAVHDDHAGGR